MSTVYPNQIDDITTLPTVVDNITEVTADTVNRLRDTIFRIEQALGIDPAGSFVLTGGVSSRLNEIDTNITDLNTSVTNVINDVNVIISDLDGEHIKLGTPTGGFSTGITSLQDVMPITEAINTFNNIMYYLAPQQPQSIQGLTIDAVTSIPIVQGSNVKVADVTGHSPTYFKVGFPAGTGNYRITKTQAFTLTTHNTGDATTGFSNADEGIIAVLINGVQVSSFNLGVAFDDGYRADVAGQGTTYSGNTGSATPPLKSVGAYLSPPSGVTGSTQVYSIALFNGFPLWQKGVYRIVNTTLAPGYNVFQVVHTVGVTTRTSQAYELFYDNGAINPSVGTPTLSITGTPTHFNFLSGLKFLRDQESLTLGVTISNAFVNTYLQAPINYSFTVGVPTAVGDLSDPSIVVGPFGTAAAPNSADTITVSRVFPITTLNQQTVNEITTVVYSNIYGNTFQAQSPSQNLLMNTYNTAASTAGSESFVDENRRLPPDIGGAYPGDYTSIPGSIIGQWDSTVALVNGNAQSFNARLIYPTGNFTTGYLPTQGASTNYSGFNNTNPHGGQVYYRAMFSSGNPRSTGTLTIGGVNLLDLTQISPNVKVEIKLPSVSGWKDFSLPFDNGTFVLATNGQGCRTGNSGSAFGWSMGTGTTASSGFMYILRITLFNTTRQITSLVESFTQTF